MVKWLSIAIIVTALLFVNYNYIDVKEAVVYYGNLLSQNYPIIGISCFILIVLLFVLPKEVAHYWKVIKNKVKIKENF